MNPSKSQNAVNVILLEYEKVIRELQNTIEDISQSDLAFIIDQETKNKDCKSIQTILTHIVGASYSYCVYIENSRGIDSKRPERINRTNAIDYKKDLDDVIKYTQKTFSNIYDSELEVYDNDKKILTS
ncbi:DinB family protein [Flavobacterium sp.]|uniref:DinB family protein n=1 Tax=Flavobacterium sp. TaxID=239 RepID=UPI0038FD0B86